MKNAKLTGRDTGLSILVLLINVAVLLLIVFVAMAIMFGGGVWSEIGGRYGDMITIAASVILLSIITYFYFFFEDRTFLRSPSRLAEVFIMMALAMIMCLVTGEFVDINARPLVFFALMCSMICGRRTTSFLNVVFALLMFVTDAFSGLYSFGLIVYASDLLLIFIPGMMAIFASTRLRTRIHCIFVGLILLIPIELITLSLCFGGMAETGTEILNYMLFGALDAVFSTVLFMLFLPLFETLFRNLTTFRLRELMSENAPLIKMMKEQARGSYNHSLTVAQLSEACAMEIGENGDLARACAYYHDVGKMKNPGMFTENQTPGENPHDSLPPELSAQIIMNHTTDGKEILSRYRLPDIFSDVAVEHHGTLPIKYFYVKAMNMSDRELNIKDFSYPGPIPSTKIAAVIMIADAVEAATRSMTDRSQEKMEKLIRDIIEERLDLGQFDNCSITMKDLSVIKSTLMVQLSGVYHIRVEYPNIKFSRRQ